jgi:pimeloyl-ACP methyl ester carboxylesterase
MTTLVVLPGLDGTATLHSAFSDAARAAFDSIAVISYPANELLDYVALERLVRSELPSTARFVLLGESFSGPIALSIAADPPSNLLGVVLSTTFAKSPVPLVAPFAPFVRFVPVRALPLPLLSWWLLGRWATPQLEAALQSALLAVMPEVLLSRAESALKANALTVCRLVTVPVLYLRGTNDRLLNRRAGSQISEAIKHCIIKDIAGPHLLLQAAPEACAQAVSAFACHLGC